MEHFDFIKECLPELGEQMCLSGNVSKVFIFFFETSVRMLIT